MRKLFWCSLLLPVLLGCLDVDKLKAHAFIHTRANLSSRLSPNREAYAVASLPQTEQSKEQKTSLPTAEAQITFRDARPGKPPLQYLSFDVVLRNKERSPRWFLLPSNLGVDHSSIGERGGVDALETYSPRGNGRVIIGRFLGTGGFSALLLPGRSEIRLRQFPVSYWGDLPKTLAMELVIVKSLKIGDESAESWFGPGAMSSVKADISENAEDVRRMRRSKRTPDNKEVATATEGVRKIQLQVSLEK